MPKHYDPNIRDDWNDSKLKMCTPDNIEVTILPSDTLYRNIKTEDLVRLAPKFRMVERAAAQLAGNMVKGTLKYRRDDWLVDEWIEYLLDDLSDSLNYAILLKEARAEERKKQS